jgi:hypothetical protein
MALGLLAFNESDTSIRPGGRFTFTAKVPCLSVKLN